MSPARARAVRWLRGVLALALLALALRFVFQNPEPLEHLLDVNPLVLVGLVGLALLNQLFISSRFGLIVEFVAKKSVPWTTWFRITVVGNFLNLFVPQLGNVYRGLVLKREHDIDYTTFAAGLLAFVWLDLLTGILLAFIAVAVLSPALTLAGLPALVVVGGVFVAGIVGPIAFAAVVGAFHIERGVIGRVHKRITAMLGMTTSVMRSPRLMVSFSLTNTVAAVGQVLNLWLAFIAIGADVDLVTMVLFQVFVKLSNQFVITPGNLGLTELAYAALAKASHCTAEQGVTAALLLRTSGMVVSASFGTALGGLSMLFGKDRRSADAAAAGAAAPAPPPPPSSPE